MTKLSNKFVYFFFLLKWSNYIYIFFLIKLIIFWGKWKWKTEEKNIINHSMIKNVFYKVKVKKNIKLNKV